MSPYEIFAIHYARHERQAGENFVFRDGDDPHDAPMPLDYFVWVVRALSWSIPASTIRRPGSAAAPCCGTPSRPCAPWGSIRWRSGTS